MSIRETLSRIASQYALANGENFKGHVLADFIRGEATLAIRESISTELRSDLIFKGSAGAGQWAEVPWIAVFDPLVTTTATEGFYAVYLFAIDSGKIFLSLNQGTTSVTLEFKTKARAVLQERAEIMRLRLPDYSRRFPTTEIKFGRTLGLPADYAAGHAFGIEYLSKNLPSEISLVSDLKEMIDAYRKLNFRGGLEASEDPIDDQINVGGTIDEQRQYRIHRRIERNSKASREAKKFHGYLCQACGFDFEKTYGQLGKQFIEAHHLKQLSLLNENEVVKFDIAKDFAVLCANCHRMIHRIPDVSDLAVLIKMLMEKP